MHADSVKLGDATAENLDAVIHDYFDEMLYIDAGVSGTGKQIQQYFTQTPLKNSLGGTLDELQIDGTVTGKLNLAIPLSAGKDVVAKGQVNLNKNTIFVRPIDSTLHGLTGSFKFTNGDLVSDNITGQWLGQPVSLDFTTLTGPKDYLVDINLGGNWELNQIPMLPNDIKGKVSGLSDWKSQIHITLPESSKQATGLQIDITAGLNKLKSQLPALDTALLQQLSKINVQAKGTTAQLTVSGDIGQRLGFNSQWLLSSTPLQLQKAHIAPWSNQPPILPNGSTILVDLPAVEDVNWEKLASGFLSSSASSHVGEISYPDTLEVKVPSVYLAGQHWKDLSFSYDLYRDEQQINVDSTNLKGQLQIWKQRPWALNIEYLYYNPEGSLTPTEASLKSETFDFSQWYRVNIHCAECWVSGQKLGEITAKITPKDSIL